MLNGNVNKNGKKNQLVYKLAKKITLHKQHTFLYIYLTFCTITT